MPPTPAIDPTTLSDLPAPTLHKILSDLPLSSILSLAATNTPHITTCILTHPTYSTHFPTPAALETAAAYHTLLTAIAAVAGHNSSPASHIIDSTTRSAYHPAWTHARTVQEINALAPNDIHYFAQFDPPASNIWDSSSLPRLQARFDEVVRNSARLQAEKLAQLHRIHALREGHVGRLKAKMDPSQEPRPRGVGRWSGGVETVKVWRYLGRWVPVPYDRYLVMVLKVLRRWPLADEAMPGVVVVVPGGEGRRRKGVRAVEVVEEWFDEGETYSVVPAAGAEGVGGEKPKEEEAGEGKEPAADAGTDADAAEKVKKGGKKIKYLPSPKRPHTHTYPASAIKNIRTALIGLKYTYAVPGISPRPRTMYTPYSAPECQSVQRNMQPCFAMPEGRNEPLAYRLNNKELEWLEAFLACCDYMSGMQEMWLEGVTVEEWWRSRELSCR
ncbi:uncharacterized protein LAJ45_04862 [Morchella importuna]|uniref:uncharacterized protein n=1 Tax=Morchella importuna TaxID=1174673 RepID=UPI001E8DA1E7|nr:uncharacterized protein LAJ45_04862 [Morchella importuna]KAH8151160.1 hypothetical protein LAJ45_04862 [Morchella importuna]